MMKSIALVTERTIRTTRRIFLFRIYEAATGAGVIIKIVLLPLFLLILLRYSYLFCLGCSWPGYGTFLENVKYLNTFSNTF